MPLDISCNVLVCRSVASAAGHGLLTHSAAVASAATTAAAAAAAAATFAARQSWGYCSRECAIAGCLQLVPQIRRRRVHCLAAENQDESRRVWVRPASRFDIDLSLYKRQARTARGQDTPYLELYSTASQWQLAEQPPLWTDRHRKYKDPLVGVCCQCDGLSGAVTKGQSVSHRLPSV